jgi:4-amino-4-deoxy-L-arabinose transferase-like glycosyltransferase
MAGIFIGTAVIASCVIIAIICYRMVIRNHFSIALLMILTIALALRLFVAADGYLHNWDERYHALVAKNLIKHPLKPTLYDNPILPYNHDNWVANHVWLDKGPVPLWSMALSVLTFGTNEYAVRIPAMILSLLSVYLTFLIGKNLFNERIGLLASFFHAINGLIIEVTGGRVSSDSVETFFIFFIQLAVWLAILNVTRKRGYWFSILIGLVTALAFLSKWTPAIVVFPVWMAGEFYAANKPVKKIISELMVALVSFLIITLPWLIYIYSEFPQEAVYVLRKFVLAFDETLEQHQGPIYYYFQNLGMVFGEVIWLVLLPAIYLMVKKKSDWRMVLLNLWWLIPFVIFSFAATKRHTYLLISAPALFIILSYYLIYVWQHHTLKRWVLFLVTFLLFILPVRYTIERVKPFNNTERDPAWSSELRALDKKFDKNTVFINEVHAIEGMFYTDYIFYGGMPDPDEIMLLKEKGYNVILRNEQTIDY